MEYLTDDLFASAIRRLPDIFDSHAFIFELMRSHSQLYVRELHRLVNSPNPIEATHGVIGHALGRTSIIEMHGRVRSRNVRGEMRENQQWKKCTPHAQPARAQEEPVAAADASDSPTVQ